MPDSRRVLDNLIMVKQMGPKGILLRLALDEGMPIILLIPNRRKGKKRDDKEEKTINLYTWSSFP